MPCKPEALLEQRDGQHTFFEKRPTVNISGLEGQTVSLTAAQFCCCYRASSHRQYIKR